MPSRLLQYVLVLLNHPAQTLSGLRAPKTAFLPRTPSRCHFRVWETGRAGVNAEFQKFEEYSCLQSDRQQQNGLKNWIEFQNYHLAIYESIKKDIRDDRGKLDGARKQSEDTGALGIRSVKDIKVFEGRLGYDERRLRHHKSLLRWIEQQRIAMVARQTTSVHNNGNHDDDQGQARKVETRTIQTSFIPNH